MRGKAGFTLIELMIVVAIIAIIAAIAIPNLLRSRQTANEGAALGVMRTISSAEASFQAAAIDVQQGIGQYGTLAQLSDDTSNTPFIDATLGAGAKGGYAFAATPGVANPPTYTATGTSGAPTAMRNYFVDDTGVIRANVQVGAVDVTAAPV